MLVSSLTKTKCSLFHCRQDKVLIISLQTGQSTHYFIADKTKCSLFHCRQDKVLIISLQTGQSTHYFIADKTKCSLFHCRQNKVLIISLCQNTHLSICSIKVKLKLIHSNQRPKCLFFILQLHFHLRIATKM